MILATLAEFGAAFGRALLKSCRDLAPIITVIALFQILVLHQAFPELLSILAGLGLVIVGLALFVVGSEATLEALKRGQADMLILATDFYKVELKEKRLKLAVRNGIKIEM